MILLTQSQRARLLANGQMTDADHIPVVKFFNPFGQGTWLATELDEDEDDVDEESLTEIEEFVRVAALLLYSDSNRAGDGTGHSLH